MDEEMAELRTKIPKDISIKLRLILIKKGKGAISEITTKALSEFFENHKKELEEYTTPYKTIMLRGAVLNNSKIIDILCTEAFFLVIAYLKLTVKFVFIQQSS